MLRDEVRLRNVYFNREIIVDIQRVSYNASPSELYSTEDYYLTWKRQRQETLLQCLFFTITNLTCYYKTRYRRT